MTSIVKRVIVLIKLLKISSSKKTVESKIWKKLECPNRPSWYTTKTGMRILKAQYNSSKIVLQSLKPCNKACIDLQTNHNPLSWTTRLIKPSINLFLHHWLWFLSIITKINFHVFNSSNKNWPNFISTRSKSSMILRDKKANLCQGKRKYYQP